MPSWSPSEPQDEHQEPTLSAPARAAKIEAARRLLEQLFEDAPADDDEHTPGPEH